MAHHPDPVARAYAILGLSRGCSRRDAARQYKRLVKRWHPDQYANDPQGQAEAAQRMRDINDAFRIVRQCSRVDTHSSRSASRKAPGVAPSPITPGPRLSEADLKAIEEAIGRSDGATFGNYLFWAGSLGFGFLLIAQPGYRPRNAANLIAGVLLVCAAAVHLVFTTWLKDR
jgi:hypothetical protein